MKSTFQNFHTMFYFGGALIISEVGSQHPYHLNYKVKIVFYGEDYKVKEVDYGEGFH